MTKLANEIITEALETGRNQYHKMAEDHWSYSCEELAPCIFCQALKIRERATVEQVEAAKRLYEDMFDSGDPGIEIDDDALQSRSDSGSWVQAWVFVHDLELEPVKGERP